MIEKNWLSTFYYNIKQTINFSHKGHILSVDL